MSGSSNNPAATDNAVETLRKANSLIFEEKAEEALKILTAFLDERDNPDVWMKLARVHLLLGSEIVARAIYRNVVLKRPDPHVMDIIAAKIPFCKVLVVDNLRLIYFNIPKCGSSSVKDAVLLANQMERRHETSHFHVKPFEKVLELRSLRKEYDGYTTFAIIRNPRDRLRSYYAKNVVEAKSLVREARDKQTYYGLPTTPTYEQVLTSFRWYRCVFDDFRHHTDSIVGYTGLDKSRLDRIFDVSETDKAIEMIGKIGNVALPPIRNMQSQAADLPASRGGEEREYELISSYYKTELELYFSNACCRKGGC